MKNRITTKKNHYPVAFIVSLLFVAQGCVEADGFDLEDESLNAEFADENETEVTTEELDVVTAEMPLVDEASLWWEHVGSTSSGWELSFTMPNNCLLTGIGATVKNNNVTYGKYKCRKIKANGNLGDVVERYVGSGNNIEQWIEVPSGQFIVGVGFNVYNDNVNRINVWRARWNSTTKRLSRLSGCLSSSDGDCNNNEVVIQSSARGVDLSRVGILGLKLNAYQGDMNRMEVGFVDI